MRKKPTVLWLILLGVLVLWFGYAADLIDWVRKYTSERGGYELVESVAGTGALLLYAYFGFRFFRHRVNPGE